MPSSSFSPISFGTPPLALLAMEPLRALLDHFASRVGSVALPVGDGHPVVVYPGLGAGAMTTAHLRNFLEKSGFVVHDWEGGVNTGPSGTLDDWLGDLDDRVQALHRLHARKVSLIGWSLGGVYAREIAKRCPQSVRQVIMLATPFRSLGNGTHAGAIYQLLNRGSNPLTPAIEARLRQPPPVPTTSIYSRSDGIVAWRGCLQKKSELAENIEVDASHLGMVTHPEVLRIVANRLAQPEDQWRPLRPAAKGLDKR